LRSNFGFVLAMNKSLGKRASVIPPFKIYFDKRLKTKNPKIAQQFWVCACAEQIPGKTRQRNPKDRTRASNESGLAF
jgi:hypothetical protein